MKLKSYPYPTLIPAKPQSIEEEDDEQARSMKEHHFMKKKLQEIRQANKKKNEKEITEYTRKIQSQLRRAEYLRKEYTYDNNGNILLVTKNDKLQDFPPFSIECQVKLTNGESAAQIDASDKDNSRNPHFLTSRVSFQTGSRSSRARSSFVKRPSTASKVVTRDAKLMQTPEEQIYNAFTPNDGVSIKLQKTFYGRNKGEDEENRFIVKKSPTKFNGASDETSPQLVETSPQLVETSRITKEQYDQMHSARGENLNDAAKRHLMEIVNSLKIANVFQKAETLVNEKEIDLFMNQKPKDPRVSILKTRANSAAWKFMANEQKGEREEMASSWTSRRVSDIGKSSTEAHFGATLSQDTHKKPHKVTFNTRPGLLEELIGNSFYQLVWSGFRGDPTDIQDHPKEPSSPYFLNTDQASNQQEPTPRQQRPPQSSRIHRKISSPKVGDNGLKTLDLSRPNLRNQTPEFRKRRVKTPLTERKIQNFHETLRS